ncbi:MAG: DUF4869 domain-containing protein [Anaeroplasmataceae bacterium]|nr:DUF4869 domain-containing protein [Anaeroplasmataceae bacterium]
MLKLWMGHPDENLERMGRIVYYPDTYFMYEFKNYEVIETDFGKRVLEDCSRIKTVFNRGSLLTEFGAYISPDKLSSGAKTLLIMHETDAICNMVFCGDNCNKYVAEIARMKDLLIFSTRVYNPFKESDLDSVFVLNTNKVYTSSGDYMRDIYTSKILYPEDD